MGGRGPRDLSGPPKRCLSSWEPWCQQLECELCGPQQLLRHGQHAPALRPGERHQGAAAVGGGALHGASTGGQPKGEWPMKISSLLPKVNVTPKP